MDDERLINLINKKFRSNLRTKCFPNISKDSINSQESDEPENSVKSSEINDKILNSKRFTVLLLNNDNSLILFHLMIQRNLSRHSPSKIHYTKTTRNPNNNSNTSGDTTVDIKNMLESDDLILSTIISVQESNFDNFIKNSKEIIECIISILNKFTTVMITDKSESLTICSYKLNNYLTVININFCYVLHSDLPNTDVHEECDEKCDELRENYKKLKKDADCSTIIWNKLLYHNISKYFKSFSNKIYLLSSDCVEDICKITLLLTCMGLSESIVNSTSYANTIKNTVNSVIVLRPLKTITQEQLSFYSKFYNIKFNNNSNNIEENSVTKCINDLISELTIQHNNSLYNIVNITNKLSNPNTDDSDVNEFGIYLKNYKPNNTVDRYINKDMDKENEGRNMKEKPECKFWNGQFSGLLNINIEFIKPNEFNKLTDLITVWEVIRLISKSDDNTQEAFKFLSSCNVLKGEIGSEFDECIELGINKGNVLFRDLIQISNNLKLFHNQSNFFTRMCRLNKKLIKTNCKIDNRITKSKNKDEINTKLVEKLVENRDDKEVPSGHENSLADEVVSGYGYVCRSVPFMMIRNYMILRLINEGSSGKVYLALDDKRKFFALKFITKTLDFHTYTKIRDELEISYSVRHENIVETNVILETRRSLVLVMEYCSGGDLITFIRRNGSISEERARNGFKMILNAIKYLHSHNIYHRDIKPENLLIQSNKLKLCDFGASIRIRSDVRLFETVGTMSYAAPEVLDGTCGYYGEKADVWSLGVVLYAMVFGQLPYTTKEDSVESVLHKILTTKLTFPTRKSVKIVKLIQQMLQIEPSKRISIQQIITHSWISNNDENKNIEIASSINTINSDNNVDGEILSTVMDNII